MTKFLNISTDNTLGGNSPSDVAVSSQKAVKEYIDAHSGGGGSTAVDNLSITRNSSLQIQTVGVIDSNNITNAIKTWTGTKAQYEAIASKDANTLYNITDDTVVSLTILEALYPVGSVYITTANTCPLSALISGSTWTLVSSGIVTAGDIPCKGNGMGLGLTDGSYSYGIQEATTSGATDAITCQTEGYGKNVGTKNTWSASNSAINTTVLGITTDPTKSGIIADTSSLTLAVNIFERTA